MLKIRIVFDIRRMFAVLKMTNVLCIKVAY